jgi:NADH-quinone oxidoreductase subunit J
VPDGLLFYLFAALTVGASLAVIGQTNPVHSVILLIFSFGGLSGLYVLLDAPFVAVIQIIIYAGAIMVLFLFVVMLLNAPSEDQPDGAPEATATSGVRHLGAGLAAVLVAELWWAVTRRSSVTGQSVSGESELSSVAAIGRTLYTDYAFAFEVTSILILTAMLGAVVLARREGPAVKVQGFEGPKVRGSEHHPEREP